MHCEVAIHEIHNLGFQVLSKGTWVEPIPSELNDPVYVPDTCSSETPLLLLHKFVSNRLRETEADDPSTINREMFGISYGELFLLIGATAALIGLSLSLTHPYACNAFTFALSIHVGDVVS